MRCQDDDREDSENAVEVRKNKRAKFSKKETSDVKALYYLTKVFPELSHVQGESERQVTRAANQTYSISFDEILDLGKSTSSRLTSTAQFNYKIDVDWLIKQYGDKAASLPLLIVHGPVSAEVKEDMVAATLPSSSSLNPYPIKFYEAPNIEQWGTHHTKMMLLFYQNGMRVVIHTANLIARDWETRTNAVWVSPLFPRFDNNKDKADGDTPLPLCEADASFGHDLLKYLKTYVCGSASTSMRETCRKVAAHNLRIAGVRFIASVPGRHSGQMMDAWGHLQLRRYLKQIPSSTLDNKDVVVAQFSSIGSMGGKENRSWIKEQLEPSFCGRALMRPQLKLVFPTVENVRTSLAGYSSGGSLPYHAKTAKNQRFLRSMCHQWKADWCFRTAASPHIKTYTRWGHQNKNICWTLATSANFSKAAWGMEQFSKQINARQLQIRSYEAGVLFLPAGKETFFAPPHLPPTPIQHNDGDSSLIAPIPYDFPLTPYRKQDHMWVVDEIYSDVDSHGKIWDSGVWREPDNAHTTMYDDDRNNNNDDDSHKHDDNNNNDPTTHNNSNHNNKYPSRHNNSSNDDNHRHNHNSNDEHRHNNECMSTAVITHTSRNHTYRQHATTPHQTSVVLSKFGSASSSPPTITSTIPSTTTATSATSTTTTTTSNGTMLQPTTATLQSNPPKTPTSTSTTTTPTTTATTLPTSSTTPTTPLLPTTPPPSTTSPSRIRNGVSNTPLNVVTTSTPTRLHSPTVTAKATPTATPTMPVSARVGGNGWISFPNPSFHQEPLQSFLDDVRPSQVTANECAWISVRNKKRQRKESGSFHQDHYSHAFAAFNTEEDVTLARKICIDTILATAIEHNYTSGKWMLLAKTSVIDDVWATVAKAVVNDGMCGTAKVAPLSPGQLGQMHLICIYANDFSDYDEVRTLLLAINALDVGVRIVPSFKPDVYTMLNINTGNQWKIKPVGIHTEMYNEEIRKNE